MLIFIKPTQMGPRPNYYKHITQDIQATITKIRITIFTN